jgi:hypothetical protein
MRIQVVVAHPPEVAAIYHSHWGGLVLLSLVARGVRRRGSGLEAVLQEADLLLRTGEQRWIDSDDQA